MICLRWLRGAVVAASFPLGATLAGPATAAADPVVAAAGDIACDPVTGTGEPNPSYNGGAGTATTCHAGDTSDQLLDPSGAAPRPELAAVLLLGDIQYEDGSYCKYAGTAQGRLEGLTCPDMTTGAPMPGS